MIDVALILMLLGLMFWIAPRDVFRDHWHFMGHRVPGVCCGPRCPHHRPGCYHEEPER